MRRTQLREGAPPQPAMPVPQDAMDLFRLLHERQVDYLLVGGMAMLTYVKRPQHQGRGFADVGGSAGETSGIEN